MELTPREHWRRNCYTVFMYDQVGVSHLDTIGTNRVLWSVDYPHNVGTFGYSGKVARSPIQKTGPSTARNILGNTAATLFNLQ